MTFSWHFWRFETLSNGNETVKNVRGLGTFESERSNAFERIVENVHGTVTFTFQIERITIFKKNFELQYKI